MILKTKKQYLTILLFLLYFPTLVVGVQKMMRFFAEGADKIFAVKPLNRRVFV